jgi:hypothetical protein
MTTVEPASPPATHYKYERTYFLAASTRFDPFTDETAAILRLYYCAGRGRTTAKLAEALGIQPPDGSAGWKASTWRVYARTTLRPRILELILAIIPDFAARVEKARRRADAVTWVAVAKRRKIQARRHEEIERMTARILRDIETSGGELPHGLSPLDELSHAELRMIALAALQSSPLTARLALRRALGERTGRKRRC